MYELIQLDAGAFYISAPTNIGLCRLGGGIACLIDSGIDKHVGRRALRILDGLGLRLECVVHTHCHADHAGATAFLIEKTGCRAYATGAEGAYARYEHMGLGIICGGFPNKNMDDKFFKYPPFVSADAYGGLPGGLELMRLPGHALDMIGVRTPGGALFVGDAVLSPDIVEKHRIAFLFDIKRYLETLDRLERTDAEVFIPSHGRHVRDIRALTEPNRTWAYRVMDAVLAACREPKTFDEAICSVFAALDVQMTYSQYFLAGCTVRSYISYLFNEGRMECAAGGNGSGDKNKFLWRTI